MATSRAWTLEQMPDQAGRIALVTGANSGIGFETARALAGAGADVVLACRSAERGEEAVARIRAGSPRGTARLELLDLASLASVRAFASRVAPTLERLDLLVLNAGVMIPPKGRTQDGFELQIGVNHLGHFALTGLLLEAAPLAPGARVVVVSSLAHRGGELRLDDLHFERRGYKAIAAYGQSKLANLLFMDELDRRLRAAGRDAIAVAAHPGWTATELQRHAWWMRAANPLFAMSPAQGALPTLRAATDPAIDGGAYLGPGGLLELRGAPAPARRSERSLSRKDARRLWAASEELTGVRFLAEVAAAPAARVA